MSDTNSQPTQPKKKTGLLEDHQGNPSSMRAMSFISLFASIAFGLITILHPAAAQNVNGIYITISFLIAAFAPKALQKFAEAKFQTTDS